MLKHREDMDSAMGPDEEPGEAHPAPADRSLGLGGAGTEGKEGPPEGGTEPQIPRDDPAIDVDKELRRAKREVERQDRDDYRRRA